MYLSEEERKLLTEGMEQSIEKINLEIYKSIKLTKQITGKTRESLVKSMEKIEEIQKTFGIYLSERSYVFQKFPFHGLILLKEIISKAREEVNKQSLEDLACEISEKQKTIEEFAKADNKNVNVNYTKTEVLPEQTNLEPQSLEEEKKSEAAEVSADGGTNKSEEVEELK